MGYRIGAIVQDVTADGTVFNRRQTVAEVAQQSAMANPYATVNPYMANPYMAPPNPYGATPPQYYSSPPLNPYAPYGTPAQNPYQYMPTPYGYTDPYSAAYSPSYYGGGFSLPYYSY